VTHDPKRFSYLIRRHIKIRHFRALSAIAEEGSISAAAARLGMSHAAVSKTRSDLETTLQEQLFETQGRQLVPTPFCALILRAGSKVDAEIRVMSEELAYARSGLSGDLSIGLRAVTIEPFIARLIGSFKESRPDVRIRIVEDNIAALREQLLIRRISILFCRLDPDIFDDNFGSIPITVGHTVVVASYDHPIARGPAGWDRAVQEAWCLPPSGYQGRRTLQHFEKYIRDLDLELPRNLIETTSMLMMISLLQTGNFLCLLPAAVAAQLQRDRLARIVDLPSVPAQEPTSVIWCKEFALSPVSRQLLDHVADEMRGGALASMLELPFRISPRDS